MEIACRDKEGICCIDLDGRFDGNTSAAVEKFIREQMVGGRINFVLNMEKVPFTASAGLRVILVVAKELRGNGGGDLRIAHPQPSVKKVFEISGMDNVLKIYDGLDDAAKSFSQE